MIDQAVTARAFKPVFRLDPSARKFRLFRVVWNRGTAGDGRGYSRKLSVALRARLYHRRVERDDWCLTLLGIEVHVRTSWGGRYV